MALTELDSFVSKFKSLLASGKEANLRFKAKKGKVWVHLEVGLQCPQPHLGHHHDHGQGNARERRKLRRAAAHAKKVIEEVAKVANEADQVEETTRDAEKDSQVNLTGSSAQEVAKNNENLENDSVEMRNIDLETKVKLLEDEIKEMKEERDSLRNTIAVEDMLHESFKERMRDKYLYDTEDTESDYESDEEKREKRREESREKKRLKKSSRTKCDACDFTGKTEAGLKSHKTKRHK